MQDFVPEDMLTIELKPREEIVSAFFYFLKIQSVYEDALSTDMYIRGAYFVNAPPGVEKRDRLIDFFVLDPNF